MSSELVKSCLLLFICVLAALPFMLKVHMIVVKIVIHMKIITMSNHADWPLLFSDLFFILILISIIPIYILIWYFV